MMELKNLTHTKEYKMKKRLKKQIESLTRQHNAVRGTLDLYREAKNWKGFEACQSLLCNIAQQKINLKIKLFRHGGKGINTDK